MEGYKYTTQKTPYIWGAFTFFQPQKLKMIILLLIPLIVVDIAITTNE